MRVALSMAALAILTAPARAQEEFALNEPTKHHKYFKQFVGTWNAKAKFMMVPGEPMQESEATETGRLALNGLCLIIDFKGDFGGMPYQGHGMMTYDPAKKKYFGTWADSMSGKFQHTEGTASEDGKTITMIFDGPDPATGAPMKMKQVHEILEKDKKRLTFKLAQADGEDLTVGVIDYTRAEKKKKKKDKNPK